MSASPRCWSCRVRFPAPDAFIIMTNNPGTYEEVPCDILAETQLALLIDTGGDEKEDDKHWVPKSVLDQDEHDMETLFGGQAKDETLFIARWFAQKEGLI